MNSIKFSQLNLGKFYFIFLCPFLLGAQDTESWNSIGFEKKLPSSFRIELKQSLRLKKNLSSFKQTFTEISISRKVFDKFKIFLPLRYAVYKDKTKERLSLGGSYKYSRKPLAFKYRLKFQRTYLEKIFSDNIIRNKISIVYKINKKLNSYMSGEVFHLQEYEEYIFDEYRVSFGLDINLPNKKAMRVFYTYKMEDLKKSNPDQINILGIAYNLK